MEAVVVAVLLWASPVVARQSAATQEVVQQCVSLGEAPMPEDRVWLHDELHDVAKNPFLWVRSGLDNVGVYRRSRSTPSGPILYAQLLS